MKKVNNYWVDDDTSIKDAISLGIVYYEKLMNEHFSLVEEYKDCRQELERFYGEMGNPPLEFEELKLHTPYWDNTEKTWCYFSTLHEDKKTGVKVMILDTPMMSAFNFEENRFYAREVKEDV